MLSVIGNRPSVLLAPHDELSRVVDTLGETITGLNELQRACVLKWAEEDGGEVLSGGEEWLENPQMTVRFKNIDILYVATFDNPAVVRCWRRLIGTRISFSCYDWNQWNHRMNPFFEGTE